jgi:hypothetical protein
VGCVFVFPPAFFFTRNAFLASNSLRERAPVPKT